MTEMHRRNRFVTNRCQIFDGIVSGRQDLQLLEFVDIFNNLDAVIEENKILEFHQCRQTFDLLYIVERQVCHDNHSLAIITICMLNCVREEPNISDVSPWPWPCP